MGISERREREREELRTRIIEAARDIMSEEGLAGLSMRAIAERIEYSPATIYLYFRDKEEIIQEVVAEGFRRLGAAMEASIRAAGPDADVMEQYASTGRAYARFALDNTAYFRVMFDLPGVAKVHAEDCAERAARAGESEDVGAECFDVVAQLAEKAAEQRLVRISNPAFAPLIGWGLVHGITSLYLSGRLAGRVDTPEAFLELIEEAIESLSFGMTSPDGVLR
ncbi:MAG TPA: TetR/AcrR family transcriptional regulator [Longimicrobiales bacterium]|nr:TetR/AcrR family transcriptional regulator [Longimicrobiales bacterium]